MKILLHACCGPCTIYPLYRLRSEGHNVTGFFYNPNIHPFREFRKRINTFSDFSKTNQLPVFLDNKYGLKSFVRSIAFHEDQRCKFCYTMRLTEVVLFAAKMGFDSFTTTLLYSKYQHHETIRMICERLSSRFQISFHYEDYREGWQFGVDQSVTLDMYRQPYCGCIFSEHERYDKSYRKMKFASKSSQDSGYTYALNAGNSNNKRK